MNLNASTPEDLRPPEAGVAGFVGGDSALHDPAIIGRPLRQPRDRAKQRIRPRLDALLDPEPLQARDVGGDDAAGLRDFDRDHQHGP
ncbi:MAG TPA: hypothetical protein VGN83_14625 [Falsiroseomonas sp.]|nr:hypothetical protein [Falsiroseomonas sp.]